MKLNKFKIVFFIIVLLTLVVSIGILGVEWTRHLELKKQTLSQESGNTNYIEKRDKTVEKPKKIKTKYYKKDPTSKSINKYLKKTQFN